MRCASIKTKIAMSVKLGRRKLVLGLLLLTAVLFLIFITLNRTVPDTYVEDPLAADPNAVVDGIHLRTGLKAAEGLTEVVTHCTPCHSAQIIMQNRLDAASWKSTIQWMQETQNLWDLGEQEEIIINYLVTNYPPVKKGRRASLSEIEWYELD